MLGSGTNTNMTVKLFSVLFSSKCTKIDVNYTISIFPLTSFLRFDKKNMLLDWSSASNSDNGTYSIKITGSITRD